MIVARRAQLTFGDKLIAEEDIERMAFTAGALGTFRAMRANAAIEKRATQDFASDRQAIEQLLARTEGLFVNHSYR